jgi:hypothetical protein
MSDQIDYATASELFDTNVTIKFQNEQYLANTIEERHGTTGEATNVPVSDIIEMASQTFAPTDIPITPVDPTNKMIVPYNYALKTVIGGGEKTLFAYNKIVDHSKLHGKAVGRMVDYIKIAALYGDPDVATIYKVAATEGQNTGANADKMSDALSYLQDQGVSIMNQNISMWTPAIIKKSLMNDTKVVNFFYNDRKPLTNNQLPNYLDVDIRFLGSNGINTIPYTTAMSIDTYDVPLVAKDAMVQIFNRDPQTSITWVPQNDRWELLSVMTSGAKIIQLNGIAFITCENPFDQNP